MRLLLDTNVLIWLVQDSPHLGSSARKVLESTANDLHISYFSILEIMLKSASGKLRLDITVVEDLEAMGVSVLMPDIAGLGKFQIYDEANKDPFDNLLIGQAVQYKLVFMTSDAMLLKTSTVGYKRVDSRV